METIAFESRVWQKALDRGLLSVGQVNSCLKESNSTAATLRLTEILIARGYLQPDQVTSLRSELVLAEPEAPDEVRAAARDPRNLVGRYVAVQELGRGGMGIVYRAWDGDLRRFVALKVLSGPWNEEDVARFRREAQSAAALRHPNIITVFEIGDSDQSPYIALELIDGRTLGGRKLPSRKAAELMVDIARAVDAAHRRGIIHRDLKPHNIMVDAEGRPRVMDFGLAKPALSSQITVSGTVMGTPSYMSPEQAQGARDVDTRSDIYSLGATLYELLTGQAPFGGKTPLETLTAVVRHPPVPPRALAPNTPKPLEAVILKCLQKDKRRRYGTAEALARDLERFLNGEPVTARAPRSPGRLPWILGGGIALAAALAVLAWPASPPAAPPPPPARPPAADRSALVEGLRLLEEARLDLYRANVDLGLTLDTLKRAEARFDEALRADPGSGEAFLARGQARKSLHRPDEALSDFAEAIRRLPSSPAACLARGRLLLERYLEEMIAGAWTRTQVPDDLVQLRRRATEDLLQARRLGASEGDLPYLDACLAFTEEQYPAAVERATKGLATAARPEEFYKLRGDARLMMAEQSVELARAEPLLKDCLEDFTQALRLRANYLEALRMRGAALWHLRRPQEAFADFQQVLRLNPRDSRALSDLATYYQRSGRTDLALEHFDRAIAADGRNYRALANRAALRLAQDRPAEARRDAEQSLKISPNFVTAMANLASACYKLGDRTEAIRLFDEILARTPRFTRARVSRGVIYYECDRWKEALADFEQALAENPFEMERSRPLLDDCRRRLGR